MGLVEFSYFMRMCLMDASVYDICQISGKNVDWFTSKYYPSIMCPAIIQLTQVYLISLWSEAVRSDQPRVLRLETLHTDRSK